MNEKKFHKIIEETLTPEESLQKQKTYEKIIAQTQFKKQEKPKRTIKLLPLATSVALICVMISVSVFFVFNNKEAGNLVETSLQISSTHTNEEFITPVSSENYSSGTTENQENNSSLGNDNVDSSIVSYGFSISTNSDPRLPFWGAYQINRHINESEEVVYVDLSYGIESAYIHNENEWKSYNRFILVAQNQDGEDFALEEISAEQFFTEKYKVEIDYNYRENEYGYTEVASVTITYSNTKKYQIPSRLFNKSKGSLAFYLKVLNNEETKYVPLLATIYYTKINGTIQFQNYIEYNSNF